MFRFFYVNEQIVPSAEASLGITDLAILRGYGVFDYFLVREGVPMYIDDYVARFQRSAALLHLELPISLDKLKTHISNLIKANEQADASIRLVLTGGYAEDGYTPIRPNLLILEHNMPRYPNEVMQQGVRVMLHEFQREVPEAKTINYLTGIRLAGQMRQQGAIEIIYHDGRFVREGVRSNVFIVTHDDVLATPDKKMLAGVTRKNILEVAKDHFTIQERDVSLADLLNAKEVFISSTTKGAIPVVQIDDQVVADGKPGAITLQLAHLLQEYDAAYIAAQHTAMV